jgi:hypothetical protein
MRGLGIECPAPVAQALRTAGWTGYNGWWMHAAYPGRHRWYEAIAAEMRGDTSSRKRKADREQVPESCRFTADMFHVQQGIPQEVLDVFQPKPKGVGMRMVIGRRK